MGAPEPPRCDDAQRRALIHRLHRIEGQVRGIERMLDSERTCVDLLTQVAAVRTALDSFAIEILHDHIARGPQHDADDELLEAVRRFTRTH